MSSVIYQVSVWIVPVLVAITFHEAAHGYVAWRLGDHTAKDLGRVTFSPIRHIELMGTIVIPLVLLIFRAPFLFGWAKPVPVNFTNLRKPRRDMVLVAAAGPGTNLLLALISAILLHIVPFFGDETGKWISNNLGNSILINLVLAVFNMLPLPPLDGGRVAVGLLPKKLGEQLARLERVGFLIVLLLLFVVPIVGNAFGLDWNLLVWLLGAPVDVLFRLVMVLTGHF
ncbi:MAG: site-2 protease family protein [Alphaproteobacteria bacterium]